MLTFKKCFFYLFLGVVFYSVPAWSKTQACNSDFEIWAIYDEVEFDKDGNPVIVGTAPRAFYLSKDMGTPSLLLVKNQTKQTPSALKVVLVQDGVDKNHVGTSELVRSKKYDDFFEMKKLNLNETIESLDVKDALKFQVEIDSKVKCQIKVSFDNISHAH
jgi:hypothetical protein